MKPESVPYRVKILTRSPPYAQRGRFQIILHQIWQRMATEERQQGQHHHEDSTETGSNERNQTTPASDKILYHPKQDKVFDGRQVLFPRQQDVGANEGESPSL